jgi:membrane fusion protein (multidrug efflux system)
MSTTAAETRPVMLERNDADAETEPVAAKPKRRALVVLPVLAIVAGAGISAAYFLGRNKETTDDAQIEAHVANVSARVSGQVVRVAVKDNQHVKVGDVLIELDARDLKARLAAARADLGASRAQLHAAQTQLAVTTNEVDSNLVVARGGLAQAAATDGTTRAAIDQAKADIAAAEAQRSLAQSDLDRTKRLFTTGALSQSQLDMRQTGLEQADATLAQARARLASAQSNIGNSLGTIQTARGRFIAAQSGPQRLDAAAAQVELAQARMEQAQAALDQADLNLSYTTIRAEVSGVVSRRSAEVGMLVSPDRPLLAIVPLDDTWVVANFKEDQLADLAANQRAEVTVDSFGGHKLTGHVDSLSGGTGARFSLLPPDNASGNFTKVVQRVPVLIRLDPHPDVELRPGLSAVATVFTK